MTEKSYVGHLLAANPFNPKDQLEQGVILVVTHTAELALGLQINKPLSNITLSDICSQIGIDADLDEPIYHGGVVNTNKIHVVHSNDWSGLTTARLNNELSVTNDISILAALARNEGPEYFKACAGFWGWESGQLDSQIQAKTEKQIKHRWETVPATVNNVFEAGSDFDHWRSVIEESAAKQVAVWF